MSIELSGTTRFVSSPTERNHLALLSALAEAPDLLAAATFLLTDILATTAARRALLLRFDTDEEQLVLIAQAGADESSPTEYAIGERTHPWMVSTLALTPVFSEGLGRTASRVPFDVWTALPVPRPHYRGAPEIWTDSYAAEVLTPFGAHLAPSSSSTRSFPSRCCKTSRRS
jgi:hypothetical protein